MSASPELRSSTASVPTMSSFSRGWLARQSRNRGTSQRRKRIGGGDAQLSGSCSATHPGERFGKGLEVVAHHGKELLTGGRKRERPRPTPEQLLSAMALQQLDWWLTAVGITTSSEAARLKLRCRAAASRARNSVRVAAFAWSYCR